MKRLKNIKQKASVLLRPFEPKGSEVRFSMRTTMIAGITALFLIMLIAIDFFIANTITSSNEKYINDDLVSNKKNGIIYAKQILMLSGEDSSEGGFAAIAQSLVDEIADVTGNPVIALSMNGDVLASAKPEAFEGESFSDEGMARGGLSAFTLNSDGNATYAYFSYPVPVEGKNIGILRTRVDYTLLYQQGNSIIRSVTFITMLSFLAAMAFAVLFSKSISSPIIKLVGITQSLQEDVENSKIDISKVVRLSRSTRKDEIGMLSRSFAEMIFRIDQQMKTISSDKYEMKRLSEYKKIFYDNVTHELKTPLTSIKGYAEVLEENGFTDKEFFDRGIAHIRSESDRMYNMVVTLLDMSRMADATDMKKEVIDINELMKTVCEGMQFKADKFGDVIRLSVRQRAQVLGDEDRLKEIFINIIDNAIKYGNKNSPIQVLVNANFQNITVQVANYGEGIDEKEIPKLFIPFYRRKDDAGKREEGSSGLGLPIVKQYVEQHGGRIDITSRQRGMTVVTVLLPTARTREDRGTW